VIVAAWDGTVYAFTSDAKGRTQVNAPARPLCVAHRGFSWVAPENTLAAYRMAMEAGAAMGECDVHLTKDGVPILLHDDTLQRTAGSAARPGDLTLAEIKTLDAGGWKSPQFAGERVPTLSEALQLVKGRMRLAIEIKEPSIARVVVDCIRAGGASSQDAIVFSFHSGAVEEVVRLAPSLATLLLVENLGEDRAAWADRLAEAVRVRASGVGVAANQTGSEFVQMAHKAGLSVFVYTVNEPRDMSSLAGLGVDAIITDRPDLLLKTLAVR
jgi:glycerophosphoryl diester phosphodiesterase